LSKIIEEIYMNKVTLLVMLTLILSFADDYLVSVELTEERLAVFADKDVSVIGELEHTAIILIDDADFDKMALYSYRILDVKPEEGNYYLVRPLNPQIDLRRYGKVLLKDGNDYLIKIHEEMFLELIKKKVMVKRLSFIPHIIKSESSPRHFLKDPHVQTITEEVDPDSILRYVKRLQDFKTRYSTHDSCLAAAIYIADKLNSYGCDTVFFQNHTTGHAPNVVGIKQGEVHPDSIYVVVCGHFDSMSNQPLSLAPGADDNASGTAGVIEAARAMKNRKFEYSIRYIAFSGEEFGLYGSEHYAPWARSQGDSIIGVFNADMIAYVDAEPESLEVIAKISSPDCEWLADFFIETAQNYTTLLTRKRMVTWMPYSDHSPFWDQGYTALCNIEDYGVVNPYYHTTADSIGAGYNNNNFCTETIRAQVAALSLLAVPYVIGVDEESSSIAQGTVALQIQPTVSNSHVTIFYRHENTHPGATFHIYDATGNRIRTFSTHSTLSPTSYEIVWHGDDNYGRKVPAGVYFVQLEVGDEKRTQKVTIIK
jgi:hypothetical protein